MNFNIEDTLARQQLSEIIGAESGLTLTEHLSNTLDSIVTLYKDVMALDTAAIAIKPEQNDKLVKELKKEGFSSIGKLAVYAPFRLDEYALDFHADLLSQLSELVSIKERLYKPALRIMGKLLTDPDAFDQTWFDKELKFLDIAKMNKQLRSHMADKKSTVGDSDKQAFKDVYRSAKDFGKSFEILNSLLDTSGLVDLEDLREQEDRLVGLSRKFVDHVEVFDIDVPIALQTKLVKVFDAIAVETEYLAGVLYYCNISIKAHNDTVQLLNNN